VSLAARLEDAQTARKHGSRRLDLGDLDDGQFNTDPDFAHWAGSWMGFSASMNVVASGKI
jgi:hypothetical protein